MRWVDWKRTILLMGPRPCCEARDWIAQQPADMTVEQARDACPRGDWLLWLADQLDVEVPDALLESLARRAGIRFGPAVGMDPMEIANRLAEEAGIVGGAEAEASEHRRCADEVRAALGPALLAAVEVGA